MNTVLNQTIANSPVDAGGGWHFAPVDAGGGWHFAPVDAGGGWH